MAFRLTHVIPAQPGRFTRPHAAVPAAAQTTAQLQQRVAALEAYIEALQAYNARVEGVLAELQTVVRSMLTGP